MPENIPKPFRILLKIINSVQTNTEEKLRKRKLTSEDQIPKYAPIGSTDPHPFLLLSSFVLQLPKRRQ